MIFLRQLKKVDKQLAVFDEEGSGITRPSSTTPSSKGSSPSARARGRSPSAAARRRLDAPPHALLGGALDDSSSRTSQREKGRADAGAEGA